MSLINYFNILCGVQFFENRDTKTYAEKVQEKRFYSENQELTATDFHNILSRSNYNARKIQLTAYILPLSTEEIRENPHIQQISLLDFIEPYQEDLDEGQLRERIVTSFENRITELRTTELQLLHFLNNNEADWEALSHDPLMQEITTTFNLIQDLLHEGEEDRDFEEFCYAEIHTTITYLQQSESAS